ncbi:HAD-IIIA family hydrolase [Gandjariella thermophila]|uniref:HAD-IIIA family hydrolase n=1 Tax=Gandjariella thermophila TaxID=1931992 RepID=UPI0010F4A54F|nr:HAD-IIIA family hydrolase [Gandjariella thermophila]
MTGYTIVIPTTGRDNLAALLRALDRAGGPRPAEIVVVDDRPSGEPLSVPDTHAPLRVMRSGGGGPAAARNAGWRLAGTEWVAFLDDDVLTPPDWPRRLVADLRDLPQDVAACQARIEVPLPADRRPTDDERGTAALAGARWITADMAYRRAALAAVGGFDERFPRAYREDADLALRVCRAGYRIVTGERVTTHPARAGGPLASVRAQRGNADNALMRRKHGRHWRRRIGEGRGRLGPHAATTAAALGALALGAAGRKRAALAAAATWTALTVEFALRRILPGPRTCDEVATMALTSVLIPPVACAHRLRGELRVRSAVPPAPSAGGNTSAVPSAASAGGNTSAVPSAASAGGNTSAVLFDRDGTLIEDVPYLTEPDLVRPVPGADKVLDALRNTGVPIGVVSNQSGVARGLITEEQLAAVNARVAELLGPFGTWQVCVHDPDDGCDCRKPRPGLVRRAAEALGVDVRRCVVIGDIGADVAAAEAAGARGVLVPTDRTRPEEVECARRAGNLAADLDDAVRLALGGRP